jgi:predicted membrane metal-binding protein
MKASQRRGSYSSRCWIRADRNARCAPGENAALPAAAHGATAARPCARGTRLAHRAAGLLAFLATVSIASPLSREPLSAVLARAQTVVAAEILQVGAIQRDAFRQSVDLQARLLRTLQGPSLANVLLSCRHAQGVAHQRGDTRVWPLLSGSGIEFDLQRGQQVILLIAAEPASGECEVLRAEPLQSEAAIVAGAVRDTP